MKKVVYYSNSDGTDFKNPQKDIKISTRITPLSILDLMESTQPVPRPETKD